MYCKPSRLRVQSKAIRVEPLSQLLQERLGQSFYIIQERLGQSFYIIQERLGQSFYIIQERLRQSFYTKIRWKSLHGSTAHSKHV